MLNKDTFDELFCDFFSKEFEVLEYFFEAIDTLMKPSRNISFLFCGKTFVLLQSKFRQSLWN